MKKIFLIFIVLATVAVSCSKDKFEELNTDKKHPVEVPAATLFTNAQVALADQIASTNVNLNVWKLFAQYWTETTYIDESNYDIINRTIPDFTFRTYYRNVLADFKEAKILVGAEDAISPDEITAKANKLLIIDMMMVYTYNRLVDMFGNIPYFEALDINNTITPAYDDAATIYADLFARLDAAIGGLDASGGSFGSADLYYGGDVASWKKFGYSLKLKMAIHLADVDATAQAKAEAAAPNVFSSSSQDCELVYEGASPNTNPLYEDLVQSGRKDFVPANTIVDIMNGLNDPRRPLYFEINGLEEYTGGIYGFSNAYANYSHISEQIQVPEFPVELISYTEVEFYLAEAAARGWSVGGDAASHYNAGITNSILEWGGTATDATTYLAQASVAYATATGTWQQKIATQAWLAGYTRGFLGWTTWRRLDFPAMNVAESPETDDNQVPKRFTYPVNEQTLNKDNYYSAVQAMGGTDKLSDKLFWDIH